MPTELPTEESRRRWQRRRMTAWILVLILELAYFGILVAAGWNRATMILAGVAALLPLLVAFFFLFYRGRKFSLSALLIATACFAMFIAITLQPLLNAQRARTVTIAIKNAGVRIHQPSELDNMLKRHSVNFEPVDYGLESEKDGLPQWIGLFSKELTRTKRGDSLGYLTVDGDAQLKVVCDFASKLPNLRMIYLLNVSESGVNSFLNRVDEFARLEAVGLHNSRVPPDCFTKLDRVHFLLVGVVVPTLTESQLADLKEMPNLQSLYIGNPINDTDLELLSEFRALRKFSFSKTNVSEAAIKAFENANPGILVNKF